MLSKKFFTWVGVGILSAVAIPALAAPHLAKMVQRHPSAVTAKKTPAKAVVAKPGTAPVKATAASKGTAPVIGKTKTATATPGRVHAEHRAHAATKVHAKNKAGSAVTAKKVTSPSKLTVKGGGIKAATPKVTTASTAKKLLH